MKYEGTQSGFTLMETIVAMGIFSIIAVSVFFAYDNVLNVIISAQSTSAQLTILNDQLEIIKNIPYPDVGIRGGSPAGSLLASQSLDFGGTMYWLSTTVRNIDHVFDGTVEGTPVDEIPGDYKLVQVTVTCPTCPGFIPSSMSTLVSPRSLESATRNGSLFLSAIDASGNPVSGATITVVNSSVTPAINITDTTDANGSLNFVDIATSSAGFRITATKSGYSTERTYPVGALANPNPFKPDATVLEQRLTKMTFAIDRVGTLLFKTTDKYCAGIGNVDYQQTGSKLIGYNPDVYKYDNAHTTDANGLRNDSELEWDTYTLTNTDSNYDLAGNVPFMPIIVDPASSTMETWIMAPKVPSALLVSVEDEDESPFRDATVRLQGTGVNITRLTGRDVIDQTDWSDASSYTSKTSYIETQNPAGSLTLAQINGHYASSSDQILISKTFDLGTTNATLYTLDWTPTTQPANTTLKFQVAANNDNATWKYVGPDGKTSSYFTTSGTAIADDLHNKRYFRYAVTLRTNDQTVTPTLNDIGVGFRSSCTAEGQTLVNGLPNGTYDITISATGYETIADTVDITQDWQEYRTMIILE